jgi:hypothetical protein
MSGVEVRRSTAIVAIVSDDYTRRRWAQAELYAALSIGRLMMPVLLSEAARGDIVWASGCRLNRGV